MSDDYKPGDKVKRSGIYAVVHDEEHEEEHEVTCVAGKAFPPCNDCEGKVRFRLVRAAHHVTKHRNFK
jgi:hypothetical protein